MALLEASALDAILAHELAHHRRHDLWINWVQLALTVVWWFNPVLWVLNRQIRKVREDCCDDLLLTRNLTTGQAYCDTLLSAASKLTGRATAGVSMGFGDPLHPLGRRFERIMDQTLRRAPRLSLAGVLFLAVLASVVLPGLRRSDGDEPIRSCEARRAVGFQGCGRCQRRGTRGNHWFGPKERRSRAGCLTTAAYRSQTLRFSCLARNGSSWTLIGGRGSCPRRKNPSPPSTRTDKTGAFTITRKQGTADRLAVIAEDPLFWVVSRDSLMQVDNVEIRLPAAGSLAVQCDLPGKSPKQPVMIELKTFNGIAWNTDSLRFHLSSFSLVNPGETVFEHLPPGQYAVQRFQETKTDSNSVLHTGADRQLVTIESAKRTIIRFERRIGQRLSGQVRGLENVELRVRAPDNLLPRSRRGARERWETHQALCRIRRHSDHVRRPLHDRSHSSRKILG